MLQHSAAQGGTPHSATAGAHRGPTPDRQSPSSPGTPCSPGFRRPKSPPIGSSQMKRFDSMPSVKDWPKASEVLDLLDDWHSSKMVGFSKYAATLHISNLAADPASHPILLEHGVLEFLGHLLQTPATPLEQQLAACFALQNLAQSSLPRMQVQLAQSGVVAHLVTLLAGATGPDTRGGQELLSATVRTLRALSFLKDELKEAILAAGGVQALVDLLGVESPEVTAEVVPTLRTLTFTFFPGRQHLFAAACPPLLRLLQDSDAHPEVREGAAGALQNLSAWPSTRSTLMTTGGLAALLGLLRDQTLCEGAEESLATILNNLSADGVARRRLVQAGAVAAVVEALDSAGVPGRTKGHLMASLHLLLSDPEACRQAMGGEGLGVILRQLWTGAEDPELQTHGAGAIMSLAMDAQHQEALGDTGSIAALLQCLRAPMSLDAQYNAAGAISYLCINHRNNKQRVLGLGGVGTMLGIMDSPGIQDRVLLCFGECLQSLSAEPEGARHLVTHGAVPVLLRVLGHPPGTTPPRATPADSPRSSSTSRRVSAMLRDLRTGAAQLGESEEEGACEEAEEDAGLETKTVACPTIATLQNISAHPYGAAVIFSAGGAPVMWQLLRVESNTTAVQDCAVAILSNMLLDEGSQAGVLGDFGLPLLVLRLGNPRASPYEKQTILEIFFDLALGPFTTALLECGLPILAAKILGNFKVGMGLRRLACNILCKLATKPSCQAALLEADCLPPLLYFWEHYEHPPHLPPLLARTVDTLRNVPQWVTWQPTAFEGTGNTHPPWRRRPTATVRPKRVSFGAPQGRRATLSGVPPKADLASDPPHSPLHRSNTTVHLSCQGDD